MAEKKVVLNIETNVDELLEKIEQFSKLAEEISAFQIRVITKKPN
jgi:hypothetical protein